jgi:uncharacterized membrane protein required for colicin V production
MLILDFIFLGIFGLISVLGFFKGLVSQLLSFAFLIINIFFSYYLSRIAFDFLVTSNLFPVAQQYILNTFFVNNSLFSETLSTENFTNLLTSGLNTLPIPTELYSSFFQSLQFDIGSTLGHFFSESITIILFNIVSYLGTFWVLSILFKLLSVLLKLIIRSSKFLTFSDRILGLLLGSIKGGFLIISVMAVLIFASFVSNDIMTWLNEQTQFDTMNLSLSRIVYEFTLSIIQMVNP